MHATAIRDVEEHPWVANNLAQAFERQTRGVPADEQSANVPLAWFLDEWDAQRIAGADPWEYGLTPPTGKTWKC